MGTSQGSGLTRGLEWARDGRSRLYFHAPGPAPLRPVVRHEAFVSDLVSILRKIREKPALYLGGAPATIAHLRTFITGVQVGWAGVGLPGAMDAFEEWVLWRHRVPGLSLDSFGYILEKADRDEERAFRLFFEYLEDYLLERSRLGVEGIRAALRASYEKASR